MPGIIPVTFPAAPFMAPAELRKRTFILTDFPIAVEMKEKR